METEEGRIARLFTWNPVKSGGAPGGFIPRNHETQHPVIDEIPGNKKPSMKGG